MDNLGEFLGWTIVIGFTLTMLNYVMKRINRNWVMKMPKDAPFRIAFQRIMRPIVAQHRWIALATTVVLLTHFYVQYQSWGFFITGIIAGSLLILQGLLGAYGTYRCNRRSGPWLIAHRTGSVLLVIAIVVHILVVRITNRGSLF